MLQYCRHGQSPVYKTVIREQWYLACTVHIPNQAQHDSLAHLVHCSPSWTTLSLCQTSIRQVCYAYNDIGQPYVCPRFRECAPFTVGMPPQVVNKTFWYVMRGGNLVPLRRCHASDYIGYPFLRQDAPRCKSSYIAIYLRVGKLYCSIGQWRAGGALCTMCPATPFGSSHTQYIQCIYHVLFRFIVPTDVCPSASRSTKIFICVVSITA